MSKLKLLLVLGALLFIVLVIFLFISNNPFERPDTKVDLSRPSVIKEIRSLGNLETASYSIEKIVEAGQEGNVFQDVLYGDRILLIAHGKVTAGVDLTNISDDDVSVSGSKLEINVPAPVILSSSLDNSKTKVYDRSQGILNRGDKDLETEARTSAESSITTAACEAGILKEARENTIERIKQLFSFAGFTEVEVNIPEGRC
jgi:hypothetical protein